MASYEKPDFWSLKAQKEHYPARSVYKLKEIDEKFIFFKSARQAGPLKVLDMGAAPGSWSLYVLRTYGKKNNQPGALFLTAVDLLPLSRHPEFSANDNFFFIQGDFTSALVREKIAKQGPYNALVSDAAPPTTGSRTVDTLRSLSLAEEVLAHAETCLAPGGNLAVKIFQGGKEAALLKLLKERFTAAKSFKPVSCRSESFEIYFIGLGKR